MFKSVSRLVLALLLASGSTLQAAELSAWSPQIEDHPTTVALRGFLEHLQTQTGTNSHKILPISVGKEQSKLLESIRKGDIGVAVLTGSAVGKVAPMAEVMRLPFILRNSRQMFSLLEGELGQDMEQKLAASGLVLLGWYDGGTRAIYSRDKLDSVAALKQVKIRVPARKDLTNLVSSLGGTPLQLEYKEVNAAFDDRRIDAAENDLLSYETEGHYKRARYYYSNNNHIVQFEALVVSKKIWDRLSPEQRERVMESGKESARFNRDLWSQRLAKARTRLEKEGVKFVEYGESSVMLSRLASIYKPYMQNPATQELLIRLMTARI